MWMDTNGDCKYDQIFLLVLTIREIEVLIVPVRGHFILGPFIPVLLAIIIMQNIFKLQFEVKLD